MVCTVKFHDEPVCPPKFGCGAKICCQELNVKIGGAMCFYLQMVNQQLCETFEGKTGSKNHSLVNMGVLL
jgi:hypothetical protein